MGPLSPILSGIATFWSCDPVGMSVYYWCLCVWVMSLCLEGFCLFSSWMDSCLLTRMFNMWLASCVRQDTELTYQSVTRARMKELRWRTDIFGEPFDDYLSIFIPMIIEKWAVFITQFNTSVAFRGKGTPIGNFIGPKPIMVHCVNNVPTIYIWSRQHRHIYVWS